MRITGIIFFGIMITCCDPNTCRQAPKSKQQKKINIRRMDIEIIKASGPSEILSIMQSDMIIPIDFLDANPENLEETAIQFYELFKHPSIDTLVKEAHEAYDSNENFNENINTLFTNLSYYYPEINMPKIITLISGLHKDLLITKEVIVIGLDFFIGQNASFKPIDIPEYIRERYTQHHIVPILALVYANRLLVRGRQNTLLSEMINHGKLNYMASQLLPCVPDSLILGYTAQNMVDIQSNREIIWANFIENELLYETSEYVKNKFIGERPVIHEISKKCPGRIGGWIGYEIVKEYMESSNISLQELMKLSDNHEIFIKSGYKPLNN